MEERKNLGLSLISTLREYCIEQQKYYSCSECIFSQGKSCIVNIPSEQVILNLKEKVKN